MLVILSYETIYDFVANNGLMCHALYLISEPNVDPLQQ